MPDVLTPSAIAVRPELARFDLAWHGEAIVFRPLRADDGPRLFAYFETLSDKTRHFYHPHPFTAEHAQKLCLEAGQGEVVRMVAVREGEPQRPIIAYFILDFGPTEDDERRYRSYGVELRRPLCRIGPSVSDALRGQDLGTVLMDAVRDIARRMGREHIILLGGVFTINERAIRFYEKAGMLKMGTYGGENGPPSWDMMMALQ